MENPVFLDRKDSRKETNKRIERKPNPLTTHHGHHSEFRLFRVCELCVSKHEVLYHGD